jgi:hypothetical protein
MGQSSESFPFHYVIIYHDIHGIHLQFPGELRVLNMGIDKTLLRMLIIRYWPGYGLFMYQEGNPKNQNEVLIKFLAPQKLKLALLDLAKERNIALSALLRLICSEYDKRNEMT